MLGSRTSRSARRAIAVSVAAGSLATVLATAGPAAARTAGADVGGAQVVCTSSRPGLAARLSQDIAGTLRGRQGTSALALYDRRTATTCALRSGTHFDSASVVKVTVLAALLRRTMEAHRPLTARESRLATAMITKSDNEATSALWRQIGPAGIQHFLTLAGMRNTVPGAGDDWGLTQITADDQLTLLRLLTADNPVLHANSRSYALGLMNRVVSGQRWGVPAGAPGTATVHLKNGWLPRATHGWRVHSIGAFTGGGNDYGIVALTHANATMNYGIATVEGAARVIHRDLSPTTTVHP